MGSVTMSPNYVLTSSLAETMNLSRFKHWYAASLAGENFLPPFLAIKGFKGHGNSWKGLEKSFSSLNDGTPTLNPRKTHCISWKRSKHVVRTHSHEPIYFHPY